MKQKTSPMHKLAERLIDIEAGSASVNESTLSAESVCNKLRPHLVTLMGSTGFHALLTRALARATIKVPALRVMHVSPAGAVECLTPVSQDKFAQSSEGSIMLLAELLNLLCAFIGLNLTLQLIQDLWPELPVNKVNFEQRGSE
jgi:hypothetical protein